MNKSFVSSWIWGRFSTLGWIIAALTFLADQLHKWWMINIYDIAAKKHVVVTSFLDLVMVWNPGVSYGLFRQDTQMGRLLLVGFAVAAVLAMGIWLARMLSKVEAVSIGLIMGGALGNAIDRLNYGAVADFFSLHAFGFNWYVFNIADVAIVAGVIGLIYDSIFGGHKKVPNTP